ncbi:MAG: glutathione S-transferase family protein [Litoreibacter sp.]|nr:glutathione S-transferase family protein [Litoreibacter sp.]
MYKVIGAGRSRAFRVLWMLEELGLDYEHDPALPGSDAARAHNPSGKIPALLEDGNALTDSTAIITYLADKHGRFTSPAGTVARARQDAITHTVLDEFDAVLWTAARHSFILPEEKRLPEIKDSLKWELARSEAALAQRIGDAPFAMGEEMTVPDIILTHCLSWAINAKFGISDPRLSAYFERMKARPAFQAASQS